MMCGRVSGSTSQNMESIEPDHVQWLISHPMNTTTAGPIIRQLLKVSPETVFVLTVRAAIRTTSSVNSRLPVGGGVVDMRRY